MRNPAYLDLEFNERQIIRVALLMKEACLTKSRAITEKRLAAGEGDADVLASLAYYDERQLAAIDRLRVRGVA